MMMTMTMMSFINPNGQLAFASVCRQNKDTLSYCLWAEKTGKNRHQRQLLLTWGLQLELCVPPEFSLGLCYFDMSFGASLIVWIFQSIMMLKQHLHYNRQDLFSFGFSQLKGFETKERSMDEAYRRTVEDSQREKHGKHCSHHCRFRRYLNQCCLICLIPCT